VTSPGAPPKLLRTRTLHQGWTRLLLATVRLEDGAEVEREVEDHGQAVGVLPYDPSRGTALLVRQLRMGPLVSGADDPYLIEAPAGMIDHEGAEAAARREALEEVGVRLGALQACGSPFSTGGVSTERISLFLAPYAAVDRVQAGGGLESEHENIRVIELPLAELWRRIAAGEVRDLKTIALGLLLRLHHPALC
jgi:nudix-type nucleoside diphosphatase (YffH/AdpP family)